MNYNSVILNKLIDKYEERVPTSNRKVKVDLRKKEIIVPDIESSEYSDFREDILQLNDCGFIDFDWIREGYLIKSIWLSLDNVDKVYQYLGRKKRTDKVSKAVELIGTALERVDSSWIRDHLLSSREYILQNNKLTGVWAKEDSFITGYLSALAGISELQGASVSMRAFSVKLYNNSKFFEREMKQYVVSTIMNFEPAMKDVDNDEINDREALAQVGIIMISEVFEFCGNVSINYINGTIDYSHIKNGACVSDNSVSEIMSIDIFDTDKIIFIENKTNYVEYCLNCRKERELVVYHGGFYSPKRGEFFKKLCENKNIPVYLWSDIDYGGFRMYVRLKKNIVPSLIPMNMDIGSFDRHKENGFMRDDKYISQLQKLTEDLDYSEFYDVIAAISESKVTVEQESFLEDDLVCKTYP